MTFNQKKEALSNALVSFDFPKHYFIQNADARLGHRFAIAKNTENGGISCFTGFMTYEEMNAYLMGYYRALRNPLT
ncbi:MAG: hypothetical protein WAS72_06960 [Saprospiraceae bacterium]